VNKDQIIHQKEQQIAVLEGEILQLKEELAWFRRQVFGQKRERFVPSDPAQLEMALGIENGEASAPQVEQISYQRTKQKRKVRPTGRKPWPANLPRLVIDLYPEVDDLENYHIIGHEITEELEYQPERLYVRQFRRPKLMRKERAMAQDETPQPQFVVARVPERPLARLSVGTRMLAQIICDKFLDHLPLYRQIKRFLRLGVKLPKSTVSGWIMAVCELLEPLFEANRRAVLASPYLQIDETTIQVLDPLKARPKHIDKKAKAPPPGKSHCGYYWVYHDPLHGLALFDYHPGRGGGYPRQTLAGFEGTIQTDGYRVYEAFDQQPGITLLGCLAHVRRKFFEGQNGNKSSEAETALRFIRRLYLIEQRARNLMEKIESPEEACTLRYQLRQRWAKPLVEAAKTWLQQQAQDPKTLPQSGFGKAVDHALKRFKYLERYLDDGRVEIDNNLVENQIRPVALGRKNYLFAGSEKAAQNAGNLYSLLAAAKRHGLNPVEYLRDLIETIPNHPINQIEDLLPHRWQPNPDLPKWLHWQPYDEPTEENFIYWEK
jgi:transposase